MLIPYKDLSFPGDIVVTGWWLSSKEFY